MGHKPLNAKVLPRRPVWCVKKTIMEKIIEYLPIIIYILGFIATFYISQFIEPTKDGDTFEGTIFASLVWPILLGIIIIAIPFWLLSNMAKWHKKSL